MRKLARFVRNVGSRDRGRRAVALSFIADALVPGYRLTWPQLDWWDDAEFNAFLDRFNERKNLNTHRKLMLSQLLRLTADVAGDTAECGVFEGASSWLIARGNGGRPHHLFDSFEGLSAPDEHDGSYWTAATLAAGEDVVRKKLAGVDNLVFHKGWIPDRFPDVADRQFAFVHIDVDLYQPTHDSIAFFYPRLNAGGILLCDDYACSTCPGATKACDEYLADKPEKMLKLDAGGGFLIKGVRTAA